MDQLVPIHFGHCNVSDNQEKVLLFQVLKRLVRSVDCCYVPARRTQKEPEEIKHVGFVINDEDPVVICFF